MLTDLLLVELAALTHDIGYLRNPASAQHENDSVEFARESPFPEYEDLFKNVYVE